MVQLRSDSRNAGNETNRKVQKAKNDHYERYRERLKETSDTLFNFEDSMSEAMRFAKFELVQTSRI